MKRLTSLAIMLAMILGLLPAAQAAEGSERWRAVARQCEELGLDITWYPEYEGLMRRYGTDRMLLVQGDKSYLYSLRGDQRLAGPFDAFDYFDPSGLAPACQNWKWGIVDLSGQTVVDFLYASEEEARARLAVKTARSEFSEYYDPVRVDGSLVEGQYRPFTEEAFFVNGVARGKVEGDGYMYVNAVGKQVYYYSCGPQSQDFNADGYAVIYEDGKGYNVMNAQGKKLLPWSASTDLRQAPWDAGFGIWGYAAMDGIAFFNVKTGEHITDKRFVNAFDTGKGSWPGGYRFNADGIMSVVLYEDGELCYKLMDTLGSLTDVERGEGGLPVDPATGKSYMPSDGPEATGNYADLHEGLVWVNSQGEQTGKGYDLGLPWGFADRAGELVVPAIFDTVGHFDYGYATVMVDGVYGLLKNPLAQKTVEPGKNEPEVPAPTFADVPAGSWFEKGVTTCAQNGVMVGTGENTFSPNATLTGAECVMLAYRLYDQAHGGDGSVMKRPEKYHYIKLTTDDSLFTHEGNGGDRSKWDTGHPTFAGGGLYLYPKNAGPIPGLSLESNVAATVTIDGVSYKGHLETFYQGHMRPTVSAFVAETREENDLVAAAATKTEEGHWWSDLGYTLEERGLYSSVFPGNYLNDWEAWRYVFADLLGAVTTLPKRFDVPPIPDGQGRGYSEGYDHILDLYEAGIIGGVDAYGTFASDRTLTRAEAAVMVARVLDESQRLTTPPKPMPKEGEGYTLTYLRDGIVDSAFEQDTYPYYFVAEPVTDPDGWAQSQRVGFLKLDGSFVSWPESDIPYTVERFGGDTIYWTNIYKAKTDEELDRYEVGVLNDDLEWIIQPQYAELWPREGGYAAVTREDRYLLLDEKGNVEGEAASREELPERPFGTWYYEYWTDWQNWGGLSPLPDGTYYRWPDGSPATEKFDWCGRIGPDGRGFVQRDGKIYRIQFDPASEKAVFEPEEPAAPEEESEEAWRQAALARVTVEGLKIGAPFDQLPQELRTALRLEGETDDFAPLPDREICKRYTAPGIEIVTSTALERIVREQISETRDPDGLLELFGSSDWKAILPRELGREYIEAITLTGDAYHMASGLKVGDGEDRVKELGYEPNGEDGYSWVEYTQGSAYISLKEGRVVQIRVDDSMGRRVGPFFDPC